jgi:hypothetical protein
MSHWATPQGPFEEIQSLKSRSRAASEEPSMLFPPSIVGAEGATAAERADAIVVSVARGRSIPRTARTEEKPR